MEQVTVNTKINAKDKEDFENIVDRMGLTQSVVIRNFVKSFNKAGGFPYDVNYPVSDEEKAERVILEEAIKAGTAKTYSNMTEVWDEIDDV